MGDRGVMMLDEKPCAQDALAPDGDIEEAATGLSPAKTAAVAALAGAVAACGGGDSGGSPTPGDGSGGGGGSSGGTPDPVVVKPQTDAEAARFVLHAALSVSTQDIVNVKDRGYEPWLDARMDAPNDQSGAQFLQSRGFEKVDTNQWYNQSGPGDSMIWAQLMRGGNSVRKRAAIALSEFFVVSLNTIDMSWRSSAIAAYWDTLNAHAFGNFRGLMEDITLNPAMGVFLNTRGNRKADPASGRVPDENFGREIMQLFSIGLYELNRDGTPKTGSDGQPVETYDNDDVTGIAKAFTGYDFDFDGINYTTEIGGTRRVEDAAYAYKPMTADTTRWRQTWLSGRDFHSDEEKRFLGTVIPAGTNARQTLRMALDALFNHPNVGPFFARQMIQRLVTSNPSSGYVRRVADVFDNNGGGTRGDLRAVFKAILLDDEAMSPGGLSSQTFGKLREPMLKMAQWGRTFGARSDSSNWEIGNLSDPATRLGQAPLRSPSVFNFFRPGYVPLNSESADAGLVAPEMQLVNETSVAGFVNFMERMVEGRGYWARDVKARYQDEIAIAHDAPALLDRLDLLLTGKQMAEATRTTILEAMEAITVSQSDSDEVKLQRIHTGVLLTMISNDYSVQR
ncbi:DUF1800 domain-containing protein [Aurantiacibacter aquimixticola]|uniref:DUF1800 family protein n=1 Tax=Aurantiacibacter aquimixticola TaxID=1958945 RepID=A0A419RQC4_9SPHN|nr:DUF1800 family protein [Aurantiacibacter aquimixticola]RJY07979.1 DUF1800 family protein [Aurantiacibacter aquimixticola]